MNDDKFWKDPAPILTDFKRGRFEIETLPRRFIAQDFSVLNNSRLGRSKS